MGQISKKLNKIQDLNVFNRENKLFPNQIQCAIDVLKKIDSSELKTNHVVVKGFTQSGKTGVFTALINIIIRENLSTILGINKFIYLTGDNSKALPKQTESRIKDQTFVQRDKNNVYVDLDGDNKTIDVRDGSKILPIHLIKNSDCRKCDVELSNSVIFIDESHYGTTKIQNSVNVFLQNNGINLQNPSALEDKHIYIISNSATPYKEIESDVAHNKQYVLLEPGENYIGIDDFNGQVEKQEEHIMKDDGAFLNFMEMEIYDHLKDLENKTNIHKAVILRYSGKKQYLLDELDKNKFYVREFNSNDNAIDYRAIEDAIIMQNLMFENKLLKGEKNINIPFLIVVIKGAYRMGISIPSEAKRLIGAVYDVTLSKDNYETTEQGLLGRMCGYYNDEEWKNIKFYLNGDHWERLYDYYHNTSYEDLCNTSPRQGQMKITVNEVPTTEETNIIKPFIISNEYGEWLKKYTIQNVNYHDILNSTKYREFILPFVNEYYTDHIFLENRRIKKDTKQNFKNMYLGNHIEYKGHGYIQQMTEENIGKKCINVIVDLSTDNEIVFWVKEGVISYCKEFYEYTNCDVKLTQTMVTSNAN